MKPIDKKPDYGNWVSRKLIFAPLLLCLVSCALILIHFFYKASADSLPFDDESFNIVVSNLVFHEISGVKNKTEVIKEALRVLKKGGRFVLQDLFLWSKVFGKPEELLETIRSWGIKDVEMIYTCKRTFIPTILKLPFMIGTISMLVGEK